MKLLQHILLFSLTFVAIQGHAQVTAKFTSDTTKGCSPVTIQFKNQSVGTNLRYLWSFGNGNVSTKENPQAIYYLPGNYTVSLTVTNSSGTKSTATVSKYITVFKNPLAAFSATPLLGCRPFETDYTDLTVKGDTNIKNFLWDFGDGNTNAGKSQKHTYETHGKFNVSLLVTDHNNCQSEEIKTNYVTVLRTPYTEFKSSSRFSCDTPFTVDFFDNSSFTQTGDTYLWNFGDGNTSTAKNPQHTYRSKGNFTVTLTITTPDGCKEAKIKTNYVSIGNIQPDFTVSKQNICNPTEVTFTNKTWPTGLISSWDFGDGTTANGYNVKHTYTSVGTYDVTLYVEESANCKDNIVKKNYISVIEPPTADFTFNDTISCKKPFTIITTNTSKNYTSLQWVAGEKELGSFNFMTYTYDAYGTYKYKLIAKNAYECTDIKEINVIVEPIKVKLKADKYKGCAPLTVTFYDITETPKTIVSKVWNYGDGSAVNRTMADSSIYTFSDTGVFEVQLRLTTNEGCTEVATVTIEVGMKSNPDFSFDQDTLCNQEAIEVINLTNQPPDIDSLTWYFYAGDTMKEQDTCLHWDGEHTLKHDSGWYGISLITEHNGCADTISKKEQYYIDPPLAMIEELFHDPCKFDEVTFYNISKGYDSIIWHILSENKPYYTSNSDSITIYRDTHGKSGLTLQAFNSRTGCTDVATVNIGFPDFFEAKFTYEGDPCAPANILFDADYYKDCDYTWTILGKFYDGTKGFVQFPNPGEYEVKLTVMQITTGCSESFIQKVKVTGPTVDGEVSYNATCPPLPVTLTCNSNPADYDSLYWEYEGKKVLVTSIGEIYDSLFNPGADTTGFKEIKLVGVDSNGCVGFQTFSVKVEGPNTAHIRTRRFKDCSGTKYIFNAEVPGYDADDFTYDWDLGNGDTSTARIASVTYPTSGIYVVTLKVKEANGCESRYTKTLDIEHEKLFADFDADSLDTDCPPLFVQFKNKSTAPGRFIKSFYWEFGDGTTSIEENPSKLYLKAGKFTVKLFIEDEWGCKDSLIYPEFVIVNGPEGEYTFDKKRGCVPLTVNFKSKTSQTNFYEWDMGDGNVIENTDSLSHTYNIPGRFIPLLILSDTFGCSYTLPPIDTIYVDPYPDPEFNYVGTCVNYPVSFYGVNQNGLTPETFMWVMKGDQNDTLYGKDVSYTFKDIIAPVVELIITSENGCSNKIVKTLKLNQLESDFSSKNESNCVGTFVQLKNNTLSDTTIVFTEWLIDGQKYTDLEPSFFATYLGPVTIQLIQENILGCRDTLVGSTVIIGDTVPPLDLEMLRVTVNDNETVQIDYKESLMTDFKSYVIYKETQNGFKQIKEVGDKLSTTYLDRFNNTLSTSYCYKVEVKNTCNLISDTFTHLKHCTIETKAVGARNHNKVTWSPYIGWDSIKSYTIYRKELDQPNVLTQLAVVAPDSSSYIDSLLYCNIKYAYQIEGTEYQNNNQVSFSDTAQATPLWDYTPPPNKLIRATVDDDIEIRLEWSEVQNSIIPIDYYVLEKSSNGFNYSFLEKTDNQTFSIIDKNVLVDEKSYFYRTYAVDECNDTTNFTNYGKTILLNADTSKDQRPFLNWSTYKGWSKLVEYYTIEIKNPDNSFTEIGSTLAIDSSLIDLWTNLNQRPDYCYRVIGHRHTVDGESQVISISNEDCSPVRSSIFYPNAFTPNKDNLNEYYVTPSIYIKEYHITIFNRWGEMVFESFDLTHNWDGEYLGKPAQQDAYAVIVETIGVDGIRRLHYGTITLLR